MDKAQLVADLSGRFAGQKAAFLAEVGQAINSYISEQGSECMTIIEHDGGSGTRWTIAPTPSYVKRMAAFSTGNRVDGNELDSALTKPVVDLVTERFQRLYESKSDEISQAVVEFIVKDDVLMRSMLGTVLQSQVFHAASSAAKQKVITLLVEHMRELLRSGGLGSLATTLGKSVAAAVSKPISAKIVLLIVKTLSMSAKTTIAKLLASTAIKSAVAVAVKKFLVAAIITAIAKAIAVKFGIATTSAVIGWVILPVIAAYITYEVYRFPKTLGAKVSERVVEELNSGFDKINTTVFENVVADLIANGAGALGHTLADSPELSDAIKKLLEGSE
ncbi:MAG: hypothetical protein KF864_06335 [Phycisphaeraceae bacterium]|nr:hypothetical protein [Phycisphaeraceae bacterium]